MTETIRSAGPMKIELAGDIDLANAKALGDCLCHAIDLSVGELVVDMTAVPFIDSCALAMMMRAHQYGVDRGSTVTWRGIQGAPARVLAITGLNRVLVLKE